MEDKDSFYIDCACSSTAHLLRFCLHKDPEFSCIYVHTILDPYMPWYMRIWNALQYIVNPSSDCNIINETILVEEQLQEIEKIIAEFRK